MSLTAIVAFVVVIVMLIVVFWAIREYRKDGDCN
jgi:hypothetical protein